VRTRRRGGLSLLEVALSLGVMSLAIAAAMEWQFQQSQQSRADAAAERMAVVRVAAQRYAAAHWEDLLAAAARGTVEIPSGRGAPGLPYPDGPSALLPSLQAAGFLPPGYIDRTPFGQRVSLLVRRLPGDKLDMMVTTWGGDAVPDALLGRMAKALGPGGGFMPSSPISGVATGVIQGAFGAWQLDAGDWGVADATPSPGHAMALVETGVAGAMADIVRQVGRASQGGESDLSRATDALVEAVREMQERKSRETCEAFGACGETGGR
jgi:type II secretory pathway pseudopilin PulG